MMKVFLKRFGFFFSVCLIITSCQSDLEYESFINLDDEYEIFVTQQLSINGGLAALNIKTLAELECANYNIPHQLEITPDNIKLTLGRVTLEDPCIESPSYINQNINFGAQEHERGINILFQDIVSNSGKISVTQDEISLSLTSNDGIKISKAKINRIGKNMIWGNILDASNESIDQIKNLLSSFDNGQTVAQGDYGLFYITDSNDVQFYDSENNSVFSFAIYTDIQSSTLKSAFQNIKESDPSLVVDMTLFDGQTIKVQ